MNFLCRTFKLYLLIVVAALLFGCSDKPSSTTKQENMLTGEQKKLQLTQEDQNQKPTKQKEIKPGANLKLISPSIITINSNEKTLTEILLETQEVVGELHITLSSPTELNLLDTATQQTINLATSNTIKIPVTLLSESNGRYYLKINARITKDNETRVRNLAVIIQVGPLLEDTAQSEEITHSEKTTQLKNTSNEKVISLPASETISTH